MASLAHGSTRRGSLLLEALVAIAVFAIFLGGIGLTLALGEHTTVAGGDHVQATFVAEGALEAVRSMAAKNFTSVTVGKHGVKLINKVWTFTGTTITTSAGFKSSVEVISKGTDWLEVKSTVKWSFGGKSRSGAIVLDSYLTNWRKTLTIGNWAAMTRVGLASASGTPDYKKITVKGNYAYIASLHAGTAKGLYIYDISNPASPVRVASSFDLGVAAYDLVIDGTNLYIATDGVGNEVQVYDITDPPNLSASNLIKTFDTPGSGKARSIAFYGDIIYVGLLDNPPNPQFLSLQWSESSPITQLDSLGLSGSVMDMTLHEGYAYVATTYNVGELQVVDIFDPELLTFAPGAGIDMTNTQDGSAMNTFGTSALIGRLDGSSIDELSLYSIQDSPVPSPPPGPWTLELGGNVLSLASVYGGKYAFVGSDTNNSELRVIEIPKLMGGASSIVKSYDANAEMRGVFYDWRTDRLYGVTPAALMVFAPG